MDRFLRYDHYKVLGIPRDADTRTIKRAYREKAKSVHPDHNASPRAAEVFNAVAEAYEVLSDPHRRRIYDQRLFHYHPVGAMPDLDRKRSREDARPAAVRSRRDDLEVPLWVFYGLHATGLLFGLVLVFGILFKIVFVGWPYAMVVFCAPGLLLIPDGYEGLRMRLPASDERELSA